MMANDPQAESRRPTMRRRVKQACDGCRRRKTKCNGEAQCPECVAIGLQCTYGARTILSTSGPRYIAYLERKVEDLENQIRKHSVTSIEGNDSQETDTDYSGQITPLPPRKQVYSALSLISCERTSCSFPGDSSLELMDLSYSCQTARAPVSMSVFRGKTTGVEVVQGLRDLCDSFAGFSFRSDSPFSGIANALDVGLLPFQKLSTVSSAGSFFSFGPSIRKWIDLAFSGAFVLWPFIDRESFEDQVRKMIETGSSGEIGWNKDRVGLLHAVIALGQRHDPGMISLQSKRSQSQESRGLQHFAAARTMVPLEECSRSIISLQTVMCMTIYLKSVSAQMEVHTYASTASHAAHQLGLHDVSTYSWLPEKERVVRQRMFIALRIFDSYITSSLGLPRSVRVTGPNHIIPTNATFIESSEMLTASNANVELLEIMSTARESMFFTGTTTPGQPKIVDAALLREMEDSLDRWAQKYRVFARITPNVSTVSVRANLFLRYSRCWVLLILYCPFLHHVLRPWEQRSPSANTAASNCIKAAIEAISILESMDARAMLDEAYAFTVDVLVMAATSLLVVELIPPGDTLAAYAKVSSWKAKALLEKLALQNCTAAQSLDGLAGLYQRAAESQHDASSQVDGLLQGPLFSPKYTTDTSMLQYSSILSADSDVIDEARQPMN